MRYEFEEEIFGVTYKMLAIYELTPAFPENETDPPEPEGVELITLYLDTDGTGRFVEMDSSEEYDEELKERILESRD